MALNLNNASIEDLANICGISRERAQLLLDYREEYGEFRTWDDVRSVPGFSQQVIEQLKRQGASFNGRKR
ncbi:MAG: helix-hairpin-helix domain-containing protein [Candidatus Methylomirabilis sp.]|nr:helix-hairpin-helix domain-containing protein [Deltaproteobacteria bacterium]